MVGKQPSNSIVFTTTNYSNRCIKEGTGSILPGSISGGTMEQIGVTHSHKHSRPECGGIGSKTSLVMFKLTIWWLSHT